MGWPHDDGESMVPDKSAESSGYMSREDEELLQSLFHYHNPAGDSYARVLMDRAYLRLKSLLTENELRRNEIKFQREALALASRTVSFFASAIKSGESWSATCQRDLDATHVAITRAMSPKP